MDYPRLSLFIILLCLLKLCFLSSIVGQSTYQNVNLREITFSDSVPIPQPNTFTTDITKIDESRFAMTHIDWGLSPHGSDDESVVVLGSIIDSTINFYGLSTFYESSSTSRIGSLDTNTLIIAYHGVFGAPSATYGAQSVILAEIIGDSLSFGEDYIFQMGQTYYMDLCILDSEHFVVTYSCGLSPHYNDTVYACLGTIIGDSIQYSSPALVTDSGISGLSICTLDSSRFVIGYIDSDSGDGYLRKGDITNLDISLGQEYCFNTTHIYQLTTTAINDSSIFLFHHEMFDTVRGTVAVVHENEITLGNSSVFKSFHPYGTTAAKIDNNHVVVAYSYWPWPAERIGKSRLVAINNTNVTFGEEYDYSYYSSMHGRDVIGMNDSEFVISYQGNGSHSKIGYISPYPVLTIADSGSSCSGLHSVPITEIDLKNITKFKLLMEYDTLNLSYISFQNINSQLLIDSLSVTDNHGLINITYNSDIPLSLNPDTLLELVFNINTVFFHSTEVLEWKDSLSFFVNNKGDTIGKRFENGYINILPAVGEVGSITGQDSICQGTISALYHIEPILNADSYIWNLEPNIADSITIMDTSVTVYFQQGNLIVSTLTVFGVNVCGNSDTSSIFIDFVPTPVVSAGEDTLGCMYNPCILNGTASFHDHVYWATLGDGDFDDPFLLDATFTPGIEDVENEYVELILFAYPLNPCAGEVGDTLILTITKLPEVYAGEDDSICSGESYKLDGISENDSSITWLTSGDGFFDNPEQLSTYYYPGPEDILEGTVFLILSALPLSPCEAIVSDSITIFINNIPDQPETPVGSQIINLDTCISSDYYTHSIPNATNYQWYLNPEEAGEIFGDGLESIVYWNNSYNGLVAYLYVQALNFCGGNSSDSLVIDISPVEISNITGNPDVKIAPNPSRGVFNIELNGIDDNIQYYISDNKGNLIKTGNINYNSQINIYQVDLRDEGSGVYYISFALENKMFIGYKLVVQ
ncbi:MAG: T9SS type A sorting domain-containing protein [Bacteroidota bacterium]